MVPMHVGYEDVADIVVLHRSAEDLPDGALSTVEQKNGSCCRPIHKERESQNVSAVAKGPADEGSKGKRRMKIEEFLTTDGNYPIPSLKATHEVLRFIVGMDDEVPRNTSCIAL